MRQARTKMAMERRDLTRKMTTHSLGGEAEMHAEAFDNVYSEAHASKDTASAMHSNTMVPTFDPRCAVVRALSTRELLYGENPSIPLISP